MPKPHSVPVATFMRVNFLVFFAKKEWSFGGGQHLPTFKMIDLSGRPPKWTS